MNTSPQSTVQQAQTTTSAPLERVGSVTELINNALQEKYSESPTNLPVTGAFCIQQSTQFPQSKQKYRNYYLLLRVGKAFGGCCVEPEQLADITAEDLAGCTLAQLLEDSRLPVRIAALDAFFAYLYPHREHNKAQLFTLPLGTPLERAVARDEAIVSLLNIQQGQKVALIGVVNPIVDAITRRGGSCLPCDFNMDYTASGLKVAKDMETVLAQADFVIATGMTLSNGSFEQILTSVRKRKIPLLVYAQTGSAIIPQFLGLGVSAISAEPFPYSQFSAEPTALYLYRDNNS